MFGFHKKDRLDLKDHDFAKMTARLRHNSEQLAKAQEQFGKLVKTYSANSADAPISSKHQSSKKNN